MVTRMARWGAVVALAVGCSSPTAKSRAGAAPAALVFKESCDGSAAVLMSPRRLVVGNDEDNLLRVYDAERGGRPLAQLDLEPNLPHESGEPAKEADLEAAAMLAGRAYWIGSHGRSASGQVRVERRSFVATNLGAAGEALKLVGSCYGRLLTDLLLDPRYARFRLHEASERAPKDDNGLNIEALAPRLEGGLWVGFRSPLYEGKALLAALLNPAEAVQGGVAQLGDPAELELAGLGLRDLARFRGGYLVLAGGSQASAPSRLYTWDGRSTAKLLPSAQLSELNGEALVVSTDQKRVLVLSDDGTRKQDGTPCKSRKHGRDKSFRGVWLTVGSDW